MLYIMRHGRTDWNDLHKLQGKTDIPLNEEGRLMAENARETYKDIHFDVCYCSPLIRAQETAKLLLENRAKEGKAVPIITDNRLAEMCFGKYEGTRNVFEKPDCPIYKFFKDPENYVAQDGAESFEELFARTGQFLKEVIVPDLKNGKDVLIVGHGAMNNSIISQVRNIPRKDFWTIAIPNCELIVLPPNDMLSRF